MKKSNITLQHVAKLAQVAPITVSRVLNNAGYVSPEKRQRVLWAAKQLNYTPHAGAKELASRTGQAKMLAIVFPQLDNPFFVRVLEGCQAAADERGYDLLVYNTRGNIERDMRAIESLMRRRVEGLIYAVEANQNGVPEPQLTEVLATLPLPIVFIEHALPGIDADRVGIDNNTAGYNATMHLIDQGYRRIALIGSQPHLSHDRDRWLGYQRAINENGLEPITYFIGPAERKKAAGIRVVHELLDGNPKPDAIFAASTLITIGVFQGLKERAVKMPSEIGLIGYGEVEWTSLLVPSLSVVSRPAEEVGQQAVHLLFERAEGEIEGAGHPIMLPATLLLRESSLRNKELQNV